MNKAIGIAVVVAAAIAIFLVLGTSSSDEASSASSAKASSQGDQDGLANKKSGPGAGHSNPAVPRPLRMSGSSDPGASQPQGTRNYIRDDGTSVRDHRSQAVSENYERRVTMPVGISPVQPQTLAAVRSALRPAMTQCIATHAPDAPSGASAQAVLTVSIVSEMLTVDKLAVSTEGLAEDEELKACITTATLGHQQSVSGAADVEAHTMTFPYDL